MDTDGTATTPSHLYSATAAECFAIVSVAHWSRGRTPPTLFLFCNRHAQRPFTNPHLSPQRQTSSHPVFYVPYSPLLTQAWLYVYVINIVANTAASGACIHGLTDARATSRQRILAGIFRFLFLFVADFWRLWHEHNAPGADMGCG
jgi:hypothetical protein